MSVVFAMLTSSQDPALKCEARAGSSCLLHSMAISRSLSTRSLSEVPVPMVSPSTVSRTVPYSSMRSRFASTPEPSRETTRVRQYRALLAAP